jgi:hypothetical protein
MVANKLTNIVINVPINALILLYPYPIYAKSAVVKNCVWCYFATIIGAR